MFRICLKALLTVAFALSFACLVGSTLENAGLPKFGLMLACVLFGAGVMVAVGNGIKEVFAKIDRELDEEFAERERKNRVARDVAAAMARQSRAY